MNGLCLELSDPRRKIRYIQIETVGEVRFVASSSAAIEPSDAPWLERYNSGSKATLHITNAPGFSGPYLIAIRNDNGTTPGWVVANKAKGKGLVAHQQGSIDEVKAWGLYVHSSPLLRRV